MLQSFLKTRPHVDRFLCEVLKKDRLHLPKLRLQHLYETFDEHAITIRTLPRGSWSTSLSDIVLLLKIALCTGATRLLEAGSFRGYTALLLAQHVDDESQIVAVDQDAKHGEAYRDTPYASAIERRVGKIDSSTFDQDETQSFDFIFLDAGHLYDDVKHDTELLLPYLSDQGTFIWHDYANWGYFSGHNGVPEYLNELSTDYPLVHVEGSDLAMYSPAWSSSQRSSLEKALTQSKENARYNPWTTSALRG